MEPSQLIETATRSFWDVLSFQTFLSPPLLILIYYLGAVGIPLLAWKIASSARNRLAEIPSPGVQLPKRPAAHWLPSKARVLAYAFAAFLAMELFWRLMFEFMLAYFQMRDYLAAMQAG